MLIMIYYEHNPHPLSTILAYPLEDLCSSVHICNADRHVDEGLLLLYDDCSVLGKIDPV